MTILSVNLHCFDGTFSQIADGGDLEPQMFGLTIKFQKMRKSSINHETPAIGNVLLADVVYQSDDGRRFNYLSMVKPPIGKLIFIHTKEDEVISCKARITDCFEFHFTDFKGCAEEHEVVGWSFPQ